MSPIVLRPEVPFATVSDVVTSLGFGRQTAHALASREEPELAAWTKRGRAERIDAGKVVYTLNAKVGLRVLALHGEAEAAEAALRQRLPVVAVEDVRGWLGEGDAKRVLLGLMVVDLLGIGELRGIVAGLVPDAKVGAAAEGVLARLDGG